MEDDNKWKFV